MDDPKLESSSLICATTSIILFENEIKVALQSNPYSNLDLKKLAIGGKWKLKIGSQADVLFEVCVCLCVFILFHRESFFRLQDV